MPDGSCQLASDFDSCHLVAALTTKSLDGALIVIAASGIRSGMHRGLDERPPQVLGAVLDQWAAIITAAGLMDPQTEAGVSDEILQA